MSTFNAEPTIKIALESLRSQKFKDFELVIADGASRDRTLELVRSYSDLRVKIISEPDRGIYEAWNKAVLLATGDFVYFLGADDQLKSPATFHDMAETLVLNRRSPKFFYGQVEFVDAEGTPWRTFGVPWSEARKTFSSHSTIPHQGVFQSRELFYRVGLFDDSFRIAGDYEWMLRAVKHVEPIFIPLVIAKFGTGGVSSENYLESWRETRRARKKNGLPDWTLYDLESLARTCSRIVLKKVFGPDVLEGIVRKKRNLFRNIE
jgi:glycosyltransferase involved in cell wall biosynthesis